VSRRFLLAVASVAVLTTAVAGLVGPVIASAASEPSGVFKARIGWFYTDSPDFPQSKMPPVIIHWAPCAKAGGVKIAFPTGAHLYEGDNGAFSIKKPPVALLSGPPLDPKDPFKAILYVGDLATPGKTNLMVKCEGLKKGKLTTFFSGPLETEYIRKDVNFSPKSSLVTFDLLDLFGTEPSTQDLIVRSCSEPGTPSMTLSAPPLIPTTTLPAGDELGTFKGLVTPTPGTAEGTFQGVVTCGSGRVGVGTVTLR
jgi:hypothetical protein